ncbi:MAG TPA: HAD-IB family hydrolase, partial [Mycobacterium sp.]|nr:HAD-IB family hydrolase [Mycobacterium sp.]
MASLEQDGAAGNASADRALVDLSAGPTEPVEALPSGPPPVDLTAAAFFDVDNTLVQGSSLVHFGRGLAARKFFNYADVIRFLYAQAKFQLTGTENSDDVAAGRRKALAFIEGRTTDELAALGE